METKVCTKCGKELPATVEYFYSQKGAKIGLTGQCKECIKEKSRRWSFENKEKRKETRLENLEKRRERERKYAKDNKERIVEYTKMWREENKNNINEYTKKYIYKRRRENVEFRILDTCRKRLYKAIANNRKTASTIELIGCTPAELKQHLEKQFRDGMSWENYGEWHVDHIVPCSLFDFTKPEDQRACFNYTNLQPLWAIDNIRKSNKLL